MKTITLKPNGTFAHLWIPSIHGALVPENAIEVTDSIFMELSQHQQTKRYDEENQQVLEFVADFNFNDAFSLKNNEIRSLFTVAMSPITSTYTAEEIASFPTQEPEAIAWQANNSAATPLIDGILSERTSLDKPTLVARIINNAATYKAVSGPAIGKKQHYEDLLYALKEQQDDPQQPDVTQADFDGIVVDFS